MLTLSRFIQVVSCSAVACGGVATTNSGGDSNSETQANSTGAPMTDPESQVTQSHDTTSNDASVGTTSTGGFTTSGAQPTGDGSTVSTVNDTDTSTTSVSTDSIGDTTSGDTSTGGPEGPIGSSCKNPQLVYSDAPLTYDQAVDVCAALPPEQQAIKLEGSLDISTELSQIDLAGLECICAVTQDVTIEGEMQMLHGLDNMESIGGKLTIAGASKIVNLSGLDALQWIGGDLNVSENVSLTTFTGLEQLAEVQGSVTILNNQSAETVAGFADLSMVGGDLALGGGFHAVDGLNSLVIVNGQLSIVGDEFTAIGGFSQLQQVGGLSIRLTSLPAIEPGDFPNLKEVVGGGQVHFLDISDNYSMTKLSGFTALKTVGHLLSIRENSLVEIDGFQSLTAIADPGKVNKWGLEMGNLPNLVSMSGFGNLTSARFINTFEFGSPVSIVFPKLELVGCIALGGNGPDSIGFPALQAISGTCTISFDEDAKEDPGAPGLVISQAGPKHLSFPNLKSMPLGGIRVSGGKNIVTLGFPKLETIGGMGLDLWADQGDNLTLQKIDLSSLKYVNLSQMVQNQFRIIRFKSLISLEMPSLVTFANDFNTDVSFLCTALNPAEVLGMFQSVPQNNDQDPFNDVIPNIANGQNCN